MGKAAPPAAFSYRAPNGRLKSARQDMMHDKPHLPATALLLLVTGACAPSVLLDRPDEWPAQWRDRRLYHTPNAFIYASSAAAAGEVDRLLVEVTGAFRSRTPGQPEKGLIVVTDTGDPPIADGETQLRIVEQPERKSATTQSAGLVVTSRPSDSHDGIDEEDRREFAKLGLSIELLLAGTPFGIRHADLTGGLGLPPAAAQSAKWAAAMPTRAMCRSMMSKTMSAALKQEEVTLAQRLLIAPWLPLLESIAADELAAARRTVLFERLVSSQAGWTDDQRAAYLADFTASETAAQNRRLKTRTREMKGKKPGASDIDDQAPTTAPSVPDSSD
jgi:hypothetical protein